MIDFALYTVCFSFPSTSGNKVASCFLSNTCLGLAANAISQLESRQQGLRWDNAAEPLSSDDEFHMGYVYMMLIIDSILFFVIAW